MKRVTIPFDDELHEKIKAAADKDRRVFIAEVAELCEEALLAREISGGLKTMRKQVAK